MNQIPAIVNEINCIDNLTVVGFNATGTPMRMMALGLDASVDHGSKVTLGFKASHVALAKSLEGEVSISNRLLCRVESIKEGALLCSVKLDFNGTPIESIITMDSAKMMRLQSGDSVVALIKSSELSILEVM